MSDPQTTPGPASARRRRWVRPTLVAVLALVVVGASVAAFSGGSAFGRMGWHGHGMWSDPARLDKRVEHMVGHLADEVDMTDDQQQRLTGLAQEAARDLLPLRETMSGARRDATALLTAATVDRAAIEDLRAAKFAALEQASARLSRFLADAAEVLTVEQRTQLAERIAKHRHRRGGGDD